MKHLTLNLFLVMAIALTLQGATIVVDLAGGGDYTNLHDAVGGATDGDTVLVMSGTFIISAEDGIITVNKELHLLGSGYDLPEDGGTTIQSAVGIFTFDASADASTVRGFRMKGTGNIIQVSADDMIIEENLVINSGYNGVYCVLYNAGATSDTLRNNIMGFNSTGSYRYLVGFTNTVDLTISNNIFYSSHYYGIYPTTGTNNLIANNLFLSCRNGITYNGSPTVVNNIFMNGTSTQISGSSGSPSISYNCFYNNVGDGITGIEPVLDNPDFVDFSDNDAYASLSYDDDNYDFHLQSASPAIDAGNPLFDFFDLDGSRNDLGAYGWKFPIGTTGAPTIPIVNSISVTPSTVSPSGTITINATGRIGE